MSKKKHWIRTDSLSENARRMIDAFDAAFGIGIHNQVITHAREDALFIQVYGTLDAYKVARFCQQNQDIYIELDAIAHQYWNVRMFCSDWMIENEMPRKKRLLELPPFKVASHPFGVLAKEDYR